MSRSRFLLTCLVLAMLSVPAQAGLFFHRQPKIDPSQRVPQLIVALKTESDEHKRVQAAEELRQFDATAFPQIVPALCDAAVTDAQAAVRSEAAQSLAHLRPVSQDAGMTLEQVAAKDASFRVRFQARNLLIQYRLSGYRSPKTETQPTLAAQAVPVQPATPVVTRQEPPLADPQGVRAGAMMVAPPTQQAPIPLQQVPVQQLQQIPVQQAPVPMAPVLTGRPVPIPPPVDGPELSPPSK